jgi:hypothetical protein
MCGDMSCCRICFFSAAFRVGVELLRFFLGEGEPTCELVSLDVEFSVGKWEDIAVHWFLFFWLLFWHLTKRSFVIGLVKRANREKHIEAQIN